MQRCRLHLVRGVLFLALSSLLVSHVEIAQGKEKVKVKSSVKADSEKSVEPSSGLPLFYKSLVPFSKKEHSKLVFPEMPPKYGFAAHTNLIPLLLTEVGHAQASYPIVMMPVGEGGALTLVVLVGLDGKNKFVTAGGDWVKNAYILAWVRRYPFFAMQVNESSEPMLAIDSSYEFLNGKGGQPFFDQDGQATDRLQAVLSFNVVYQQDAKRTQTALEALQQSGVLEPGGLQRRTAADTEVKTFTGFLVVNEKKLMDLPDEQIIKLQRSGGLGLAYAQMLSMRNVKNLLD